MSLPHAGNEGVPTDHACFHGSRGLWALRAGSCLVGYATGVWPLAAGVVGSRSRDCTAYWALGSCALGPRLWGVTTGDSPRATHGFCAGLEKIGRDAGKVTEAAACTSPFCEGGGRLPCPVRGEARLPGPPVCLSSAAELLDDHRHPPRCARAHHPWRQPPASGRPPDSRWRSSPSGADGGRPAAGSSGAPGELGRLASAQLSAVRPAEPP